MENQSKEKERAILTVGRPDLEQLSRDEQQVFYSTLLACVIEYYNKESRKLHKS